MGAATKCYKYLRKLFKFEQMDFEFALWQIIFLFVAPQKVYRNFKNRKRTLYTYIIFIIIYRTQLYFERYFIFLSLILNSLINKMIFLLYTFTETKSQFARDDPAFFVLLTCCYSISTLGFVFVLGLGFFQYIKLLLYMMFVEYLCVGFLIATIFW